MRLKLKIRTMTITVLVFALFLIGTAQANIIDDILIFLGFKDAPPPETVLIHKDWSTETFANPDGTITINIYGALKNVKDENGNWVDYNNATSFLPTLDAGKIKLEYNSDGVHDLTLLDFNATSISFELFFDEKATKHSEYEHELEDGKLKTKFKFNETVNGTEQEIEIDIEIEEGKNTQIEFHNLKSTIGKKFKFGSNSTTITLQDANTENFEDSEYWDTKPGNIDEDCITIFKFNISEIPASQTIDSAYLYLYVTQLGVGWDDDMNVKRVTNEEDWVEGDSYMIPKTQMEWANTTTMTSGICGSTGWCNTTDIKEAVITEYDAGNTNVTLWVEDPDYNSILTMDSGTGSGGASSLYLGMWDDDVDHFGLGDHIRFDSKESGTANQRPYLSVTYSSAGTTTTTAPATTSTSTSTSTTTLPPRYWDNQTNSTDAGEPIEHDLRWTDDGTLDGFVFQFCNGTWDGSECSSGLIPVDSSNITQNYMTTPETFTTEVTVNLDEEYFSTDGGYTFDDANDRIYVNETATYKVHYSCVARETTLDSRSDTKFWLEVDGTDAIPSYSHNYIRGLSNDEDETSASGTVLVNMTDGEYLTLQAQRDSGSTTPTTEDDCWIYINKIKNPAVMLYDTNGGESVNPTTNQTVTLDTVYYNDPDVFTPDLSNNRITVDETGWYRTYYHVCFDQTVQQRAILGGELKNNGNHVPLTYGLRYVRDTNSNECVEGNVIMNFTAGDNISINLFTWSWEVAYTYEVDIMADTGWLVLEQLQNDDIGIFYDAGAEQSHTTENPVELDTDYYINTDNYTHSADDSKIYVNNTGWYEIMFMGSFDDKGAGTRHTSCSKIKVNNVDILSRSCVYTRGAYTVTFGTTGGVVAYNFTDGDYFELVVNEEGTSDTSYTEPGLTYVAISPIYFDDLGGGGSNWVNDTFDSGLSGSEDWSNVTKIVNGTDGANMAWKVYANDTGGTWNETTVFTYTVVTTTTTTTTTPVTTSTTIPADTCSCPGSGHWEIDLSDNCELINGVCVVDGKLKPYNTGWAYFNNYNVTHQGIEPYANATGQFIGENGVMVG